MAYDMSFCCKLYHLSEWMQEKVIRGNWGDLWALIVPQKALISFRNSNTCSSGYIEQQNLIINAMTQTNILWNLSTLIILDLYFFSIGGPKPSIGLNLDHKMQLCWWPSYSQDAVIMWSWCGQCVDISRPYIRLHHLLFIYHITL